MRLNIEISYRNKTFWQGQPRPAAGLFVHQWLNIVMRHDRQTMMQARNARSTAESLRFNDS